MRAPLVSEMFNWFRPPLWWCGVVCVGCRVFWPVWFKERPPSLPPNICKINMAPVKLVESPLIVNNWADGQFGQFESLTGPIRSLDQTINGINSLDFNGMSFKCTSVGRPWSALSKVFWVQEDLTKRLVANEGKWRMERKRWRALRPFSWICGRTADPIFSDSKTKF